MIRKYLHATASGGGAVTTTVTVYSPWSLWPGNVVDRCFVVGLSLLLTVIVEVPIEGRGAPVYDSRACEARVKHQARCVAV